MPTLSKKRIILGIDPGFGRTGWGIIEGNGTEWRAVAAGCIETKAGQLFFDRLLVLHNALVKIIKKYNPNEAAVEELFFAKNAKTAMQVGQARGVILLSLSQAGLLVNEFTPLQVKQTLTSYGRAEKCQVQKMVEKFLKLTQKIRQDDTADALAVALTCGFCMRKKKI